MKLRKYNQKGVALLPAVIVLVVILAAGGVFWWVKDHYKKTTNLPITTISPKAVNPGQNIDETANWKRVTSSKSAFSINIPDGWHVVNSTDLDLIVASLADGVKYAPGTPATATSKPVDDPDAVHRFEIFVDTNARQFDTDSAASRTSFTASGLTGTRYSEKVQIKYTTDTMQEYEYLFEHNGKACHAYYRVLSGESDSVAIVEKALKTLDFK